MSLTKGTVHKDFKINEEQAKIGRLIYKLFLGGRSFYAITKELEKRGIKSPSGKDKWYISTVRSILTNEKYRGDALIQKEYTAISSIKRDGRTWERFHSIMWRSITRRLSRRTYSTLCNRR